MATYLGFAPTDTLKNDIQQLLANLANKSAEPQYHLANRISAVMTDEIIDCLLLNLVKSISHGESSRMINFLGSFLKKTMHVMLKMMLGKASNSEIDRRTEFVRARFLNLPNDIPRLGFPMPQDLYQEFQRHFSAIDAGQGKEHTEAMVACMLRFADLALVHFYDEFVDKLDLGMILRKGAAVTRAGIHKENHSILPKMIRSLEPTDMKLFADYFRGMLVER